VWGGQVALQFVRAFRSDAFRTRAEPLSAVPLALVCLARGSLPIAAVGCGLAVATFFARCVRRFGKPRLDRDGRPLLLPRPWRAVEVCLSIGLCLAMLLESDCRGEEGRAAGVAADGGVRGSAGGDAIGSVSFAALLCAHALAAACILSADVLLHPNLELSGAVEWCVCLAVACLDTSLVPDRPRVHSITLYSMLALCVSILYQLRRQHALEYASTLMHIMAAVLAYQGCHCVHSPTLMHMVSRAMSGA
jgi:hypothetical protein